MYTKYKVVLVVVLLAIVAAVFNSGVQAGTFPGERTNLPWSQKDLVMSRDASPAEQGATLALWTRDAIAAAQPLPFPEAAIEAPADEAVGEPGEMAGGLPDPGADLAAQSQYPDDWQLLAEAVESLALTPEGPEGSAGVFTGYRVNYFSQMHLQYPWKAIGRLTFMTPSGSSSCSAAVISPNNIIATAAHCVYNTVNNQWYSNWAFSPAWRNNSSPYGVFPWTNARVLTAWINANGTVTRYDVALIKLGNNSAGYPVTYYTGYLGRSWNFSYTRDIHAVGYPSNLYSGLYQYLCTAETFSGGTDVVGMGCNMTYGSSGGPWIRNYAPYTSGSVNYVNAVVSGGTPGSNTFYGPRFSSDNIVILCNPNPWGC